MANLLAAHTLAELIDIIEADLSDSGNAEISASEVQAAIRQAIYDLNRHMPQQKIYELTLDFQVTDESFTSDYGIAVSLNNKPIRYTSESVHADSGGGTKYVRDTDYTIDYSNGTITVLSTGSISDSTTVYIDYDKSKLAIDLSSLTDLIRVVQVEYPMGSVPQDAANYYFWMDLMWVGARGQLTSQEQMGETNHIVIYYEAEHNIAVV